MSMAKVSTYRAHDTITDKRATQLEREGQESFDNFIVQAVGREPFLSFSHTGDSSIHWLQLLQALEQQGTAKKGSRVENMAEETDRQQQGTASTSERHVIKESGNISKGCGPSTWAGKNSTEHTQTLKIPEAVIAFAQAAAKANGEREKCMSSNYKADLPGWPLLTSPSKVQLQKCDKCLREFCSQINYRRHIRVHRRSLNADKVFPKNRDLLAEFWDKLSWNEMKELASLKYVTFEDISGSSLLMAMGSLMRKPGFSSLPHSYMKAGVSLYDIVEGRSSVFPISSQELFAVLDDASEKTFLCAGTAVSLQKFVFDGEAAKVGMEMRNLIACASFLLEQKLVKAWLADKDVEALKWQKLLFEEEEAAQKRQAELLMRKRMKKLRQKEQKMKENVVADERDPEGRGNAVEDALFPTEETSSPDTAADEIYPQEVADDDRWQMVPSSHPTLKSPRNGFGAFHSTPPLTKPAGMLRPGGYRDPKGAAHFSGQKVWARKSKAPCEEEKERTQDNPIADEGCKVLIGSISVPLKDSPPSPPVGQRELFSSRVATAFLSQRWRDALSSEHAILLSSERETPPVEDQSEDVVAKLEMGYRPKRSFTLKYIPKQILTG